MLRLVSAASAVVLLGALALPAQDEKKVEEKKPDTLGKIVRLDDGFDKLIAKDAVLEKLAGGYSWVEGPVWSKKGKFLLFSDIPNNSIFKYEPGKKVLLFLKPSGYNGPRTDFLEPGSNGLLFDAEGRLILMEHGDRQVSRISEDGKEKTVLAGYYEGKKLNSPNDGALKSNGDLYFTDPPYGRMVKGKPGEFPERELDFCGVYRLSKDGKLTLLTKEMTKPNGIAFSPDEKTLYVANSDPKSAIWKKFAVKADGTLEKGEVFFDATATVGKSPGLPDGLKVDKDGNLFATGPGGVLVFSPQGKHLGTIATGVPTSNCGWGEDGTVLYVTADKTLCKIKTKTKGAGW